MVATLVDFRIGRRLMMGQTSGKSGTAIIVKPQYLVQAQRRLRLPGRAKDFLEYLDEGTFFKHGIHRNQGTPEHWCVYDLPKWSAGMGMPKPNIHRLREYLLALRIIQIQVDNEGTVWIGWNLNTDEWVAPPKHGGTREGAGRPKNQDDNGCLQTKTNQDDNKNYHLENDQQIKMITSERHDGKQKEAAAAPLRTLLKKDQEPTDANASGDAACADAPEPAPSAPVWDDVPETAKPTANITPLQAASSKRRSSAAPNARASPLRQSAAKEKASPEQQRYRDACWALLRGPGKRQGVDLGKSGDGKEVKAMDWLYRNKVPGQKVTEMFHLMLADPKYRTKSISLTHLVDEYPSFKHDPDAFRAEYESRAKRGATNGQRQPVQATQAARGRPRRSDPHEGTARISRPGDDD